MIKVRPGVWICSFFIFVNISLSAADPQNINPDSLFNAAKKSIETNDYPTALIQFNQYLRLPGTVKDNLLTGNAHIGLGISNERSGNYDACLQHYFLALQHYEKTGNEKKVAGTLKNIGNIFRVLRSYDKSKAFLQQALSAYYRAKDSAGTGNALNDLGIVYLDQQQYDSAATKFNLVITHYDKNVKEEVKSLVLNNLASCYMNLEQYEKASRYFYTSLSLAEKRNDNYGSALVYLNLCELAQKQGKLQESLELGNKSIRLAEGLQLKGLLAAAYKAMATTSLQLQDYRQASRYLTEQLRFQDTVYKEKSSRNYAEMETKYQNEKKQAAIIKLEQLNALNKSQIRNQRLERNLLLTGLAAIIIISIVLLKNYALKKAANRQLHTLNDKLNEANLSKTKLFGILSHDLRAPVSNLFSYLQLQRMAPGRLSASDLQEHNVKISDAAENLLETMEDLLIWSKSQMEQFSPVLEAVNLAAFVDEIKRLLEPAANNKAITLESVCATDIDIVTDPNFLRIICRNLLSNAIKFTPTNGRVNISCLRNQNIVTITVEDNGPGINESALSTIFDWSNIRSNSSGLGLKLAKEFTEKLGGTIRVESSTGTGTRFMIELPG